MENDVRSIDQASPQASVEHGGDSSSSQKSPKIKVHLMSVALAVFVIAILALVITFIHSQQSTEQTPTPAQVSITARGFNPETIRIKAGQSVVWTNTDIRVHQVASDPYPEDNGLSGFVEPTPLQAGMSYGFTFSAKGTYTYHDQLQPYRFKGEVIVQ